MDLSSQRGMERGDVELCERCREKDRSIDSFVDAQRNPGKIQMGRREETHTFAQRYQKKIYLLCSCLVACHRDYPEKIYHLWFLQRISFYSLWIRK